MQTDNNQLLWPANGPGFEKLHVLIESKRLHNEHPWDVNNEIDQQFSRKTLPIVSFTCPDTGQPGRARVYSQCKIPFSSVAQ